MKANASLPPDYSKYAVLEPSKQPIFVMGALVTGIALLLIVGWLLVLFVNARRPTALDGMRLRDVFSTTTTGSSVAIPAALLRNLGLALIAVVIVHELVHGLFYWLFSGHRPKFGFQGLLPYAAAPTGVYFPRNQFLTIGLAPLVLLTAVGLLLMVIVPIAFVPLLVFFVALNAAGASGDLIMAVRLGSFSDDTLLEDNNAGVTIYRRARKRNAA